MKKVGQRIKSDIVKVVDKAETAIYRKYHGTNRSVDRETAQSQQLTESSFLVQTEQLGDALGTVKLTVESPPPTEAFPGLQSDQSRAGVNPVKKNPKRKKLGKKIKDGIVTAVEKAEEEIYRRFGTSDQKAGGDSPEPDTAVAKKLKREKTKGTKLELGGDDIIMRNNKDVQITNNYYGSPGQPIDGSSIGVERVPHSTNAGGKFVLEGNNRTQLCFSSAGASVGMKAPSGGETVIKGNTQTQMYSASGSGDGSGTSGNQASSSISKNEDSQVMQTTSSSGVASSEINGNIKSQVMLVPSSSYCARCGAASCDATSHTKNGHDHGKPPTNISSEPRSQTSNTNDISHNESNKKVRGDDVAGTDVLGVVATGTVVASAVAAGAAVIGATVAAPAAVAVGAVAAGAAAVGAAAVTLGKAIGAMGAMYHSVFG